MEEGTYTAEYIGKDGLCGFKNGETYCIEVVKDIYGYSVMTDGLYIRYASSISINQNWVFNQIDLSMS